MNPDSGCGDMFCRTAAMTDNKVECECGSLVLPCGMKAHLKTKKHQDLLRLRELDQEIDREVEKRRRDVDREVDREVEKQLSQRERDQAERQKYRAKIEKLQKKYSKWHEVWEYGENDMVGYVSGTRIQLWYYPKPIGIIITPDNSVRQWTLQDKPWGEEYKFSVPFATEDEIEIENRDGMTLFRFRKQDETEAGDEEDECEACGKLVIPIYEDEKGGWTIGNCLTCDAMCCRECLSKYSTEEDICCVLCTPHK